MRNSSDLTTKKGLKSALSSSGAEAAASLILGPVGGRLGFAAAKAISSFFDSGDNKSTIKQQEEAAAAIIKAGKENGAQSIEIELEQEAGLKVAGVFKAQAGNGSIDTAIGKSGKMKMKITYK